MGSIKCIRHPTYNGITPPILSCKICCGIFVSNLKDKQKSQTSSQSEKQQVLEEKSEQHTLAESATNSKS